MSLPTRECGLKHDRQGLIWRFDDVTPYAGVWIETLPPLRHRLRCNGHSLRGSVD